MKDADAMTPFELRQFANEKEVLLQQKEEVTKVITKDFRAVLSYTMESFERILDEYACRYNNDSHIYTLEDFDTLAEYIKTAFCESVPLFEAGEEVTFNSEYGYTCHGMYGDFEDEDFDLDEFVTEKNTSE